MVKLIYATFPDKDKATSIAKTLLEEKLIACTNIIGGATSIYRWQEKIEQAEEAILIAKTSAEKAETAVARIKELHPYDLPAILILPVESGFLQFLNWIEEETAKNNPRPVCTERGVG